MISAAIDLSGLMSMDHVQSVRHVADAIGRHRADGSLRLVNHGIGTDVFASRHDGWRYVPCKSMALGEFSAPSISAAQKRAVHHLCTRLLPCLAAASGRPVKEARSWTRCHAVARGAFVPAGAVPADAVGRFLFSLAFRVGPSGQFSEKDRHVVMREPIALFTPGCLLAEWDEGFAAGDAPDGVADDNDGRWLVYRFGAEADSFRYPFFGRQQNRAYGTRTHYERD